MNDSTVVSKLLVLLVLKAAVLFFLIQSGHLGLSPDEAQYWTWSKHLDWGYYSKPPAIAWQIKLTTLLFGDTELGVRFGSLLLSFGLSLTLFFLGSFWAAVVMALSPLGVFLSFAATTDPGSIFFLTLAILALVRGPNYWICGLCILCGGLYKWNVFLFWPFVFLFLPFVPSWRKKSLIGGVLLSLLAFLPTLYWNWTHDFATFRHVWATTAKATGTKGGNFFDFLGAQIGIISPIYFVLLLLALFRRHKEKWLWFCATFTASITVFFILSLFSKIQPNWAAFLYPPGFAVLAFYSKRLWLLLGTLLSVLLISLTLFLPISYKISPFRQNLGWHELKPSLMQAGYKESDFLFADKYQATSLLSFYVSQKAYFFNLGESRKNQFSYWPQMNSLEKGNTGYFVVIENSQGESTWYEDHYKRRLQPYFNQVTFKGAYPLVTGAKYAFIFRGDGYNGLMPPEKEKW